MTPHPNWQAATCHARRFACLKTAGNILGKMHHHNQAILWCSLILHFTILVLDALSRGIYSNECRICLCAFRLNSQPYIGLPWTSQKAGFEAPGKYYKCNYLKQRSTYFTFHPHQSNPEKH